MFFGRCWKFYPSSCQHHFKDAGCGERTGPAINSAGDRVTEAVNSVPLRGPSSYQTLAFLMFWLNETFFCFFGVNDQVQTNWRVLVWVVPSLKYCTKIRKKFMVFTDFTKVQLWKRNANVREKHVILCEKFHFKFIVALAAWKISNFSTFFYTVFFDRSHVLSPSWQKNYSNTSNWR